MVGAHLPVARCDEGPGGVLRGGRGGCAQTAHLRGSPGNEAARIGQPAGARQGALVRRGEVFFIAQVAGQRRQARQQPVELGQGEAGQRLLAAR